MFQFTIYKRNANQNHELSPHICENVFINKTKKQLLEKIQRKCNAYAMLVGKQIGTATMENIMKILQK